MKNDLKNQNPNYTFQLTEKITKYNRLKNLNINNFTPPPPLKISGEWDRFNYN